MGHFKASESTAGLFGIAGHVGVGHTHSHSSFVQDDSAGFAVVASIMAQALSVDTRIKYVQGDPATGTVVVETMDGGVGQSYARRGLTPVECELLQRAVCTEGVYTQRTALHAFGRIYGQGAMEPPVALQGALALAVLDTFAKKAPGKVHVTRSKFSGRIDKMAVMVVDIDDMPVSLLLNINGSEGGIGPDEDNEGNTTWDEKGEIMRKVSLDRIPTIVVESKAYIPALASRITEATFLIRAQEEVDNTTVAKALVKAAGDCGYPYLYLNDVLPQVKGGPAKATADLADKIISMATNLKEADAAGDKVNIIAELARLISEDAGGVSFMSSSRQEIVRAAGMVPGTSAVMSLLVTGGYREYWKIPQLDHVDVSRYVEIIRHALPHLRQNFENAYAELKEKTRSDNL